MNATIQANGALLLTAGNDDRARIRELQTRTHDPVSILSELLEPFFTNGSYEPFDAGDANPFVGLTSAPCIAEHLSTHDDGQREIVGRLWYFADYMLRDPTDELKRYGRVTFASAD
jgi:hypothetical protein